MEEKKYLKDVIGQSFEDDLGEFDLTEINNISNSLSLEDAIDLAHAELLQLRSLRGADICVEYLSKTIKLVNYLESKINTVRSKASFEYKTTDGTKATADMRKLAGEAAPGADDLSNTLAKAKAAKSYLEKKYEIMIRAHHHYKDISNGMRKGIVSQITMNTDKVPGWD
jgi:hypothetical protein